MEASVQGIVIFGLALGAHLEGAHGGFRTVIGHTLNYGEPRATIGAVGEWIAVAAVLRIRYLVKTSLTGGHIWRNELEFTSLDLALSNLEGLVTGRSTILNSYVLNTGQWWCLSPEFLLKLSYGLRFAFHFNSDIFRSVVDPALKIVFDSQSVNEWPEAYALNNAPNANRG